ncbi:MAG: GTP-binding DUF697 domain-containing protein [Nitrosomonas sp.]|nr:MAG: GTP-binding DUF697 domain-containing protein [Nitrosomonas sp.]
MKITDLKNLTDYWKQLQTVLLSPKIDETMLETSLRTARAKLPVPVIWLIGKTQSGKTSIVRALTGSEAAQIGNGFQPCTRRSEFYDYPSDVPVIRFLDTRGLGEVAYDPAEDLRYCESQAHLLVAVMKAADTNQTAVLDVLHTLRERHPEWPVLVVQTHLHELYPGGGRHILPWPYDEDPLPQVVPADLQRTLLAQRMALKSLPGFAPVRWVAVDLTLPEDGFDPSDYGLNALWQAIESLSSLGLQQQLGGMQEIQDLYARAAHQQITGYSLIAAGLGSFPVVDLVAVTIVQAKLLRTLADIYGQSWDRGVVAEFLGLIGAGIASGYAMRFLSRAIVKLIPFWGQAAGMLWSASASGASTYALGKTAVYFFVRRKNGLNIDAEAVRRIFEEELKYGSEILKHRLPGKSK